MELKRYTFPYGRETQSVELPEEHVLSVLEGKSIPPCNVEEATQAAMRSPTESAPLREVVHPGERVCILLSDFTRSWCRSREFLPYIIAELNEAGIGDRDIFIQIAQGTHREHTREEDVLMVGNLIDRIPVYQHHSERKEELVYMGDTTLGTPVCLNKRVVEADRVILVNGITTHLFAGYGGGRKLILPGIAGDESIQANHGHALSDTFGGAVSEKTRLALLENNPVNQDMQEAADMLQPDFLVHSIVNGAGQIISIVGGDPYKAWLQGTEEVRRAQEVVVSGYADVAITSAGGFPKDTNMYQGTKCYDPAKLCVKKGGIIIALIEAEDITEPPTYMESFRFDTVEKMEEALRHHFSIPFFVAFNLFCMSQEYTIYLVTKKENFDMVRKTNQIPCVTLQEAWEKAHAQLVKEGKADYTIHVLPHGGAILPVVERK